MGSSLLHCSVYMRQAYAIAAWGEIIYRVDGCLAVPQCRYLTYSHAFFVWYLSEPKEKRYGNEIDK